jgi:hypothetical protein
MILLVSILLLSIGFALSQTESEENPIEPIKSDKITLCYRYTLDKETYSRCSEYPKDLVNKCQHDRYGNPINCRDMLLNEVNKDIKNWYSETLPREITDTKTLSDMTVYYTSEELSALKDGKWDFINEKFK